MVFFCSKFKKIQYNLKKIQYKKNPNSNNTNCITGIWNFKLIIFTKQPTTSYWNLEFQVLDFLFFIPFHLQPLLHLQKSIHWTRNPKSPTVKHK